MFQCVSLTGYVSSPVWQLQWTMLHCVCISQNCTDVDMYHIVYMSLHCGDSVPIVRDGYNASYSLFHHCAGARQLFSTVPGSLHVPIVPYSMFHTSPTPPLIYKLSFTSVAHKPNSIQRWFCCCCIFPHLFSPFLKEHFCLCWKQLFLCSWMCSSRRRSSKVQ